MNILAFDCSANSMSVALFSNNQLLEEINYLQQLRHSEKLVLEITNLLKKFSIKFSQIDLYLATNGPGSYTGIRVALSVLKMLNIATAKPCIAVNSCAVLAYKYAHHHSKVCVAIEANINEVYLAKYQLHNLQLQEILYPLISNVDEAQKLVKNDEFLCGSAQHYFPNVALKSTNEDVILAQDIVRYGQQLFLTQNYSAEISPLYLRDPRISVRK